MRILYYSVHSVLEDDEIRMLKRLGHEVFPLGVNFGFDAVEPFRDSISFTDNEKALLDDFHRTGCAYRYGHPHVAETVLTKEFVGLFDVVIVMHDLSFIERFWAILSTIPVIWRTIGQNIEGYEPVAAALCAKGLNIVRYSPLERQAPNYSGETALIRFGKNPEEYGPWTGANRTILTFANLLIQRYPKEAQLYIETIAGLPTVLGGVGNDSIPGNIGLLTPEEQRARYNESRAYLYCSGSDVPYTLNFIEALMTGLPLIAFQFSPHNTYYEIPNLLESGGGMVASSVEDAQAFLRRLLDDEDYAQTMSQKSRNLAIKIFGLKDISLQWNELLLSLAK